MKQEWRKITQSVAIIAGVAFMYHPLEFDKHNLAINTKDLHSHQERYEPHVTRTTFVTTYSSQGTTSTTSTTVDPRVFTS